MKILKDSWLVFDNEIALSEALAQDILSIAKKSIFKRGYFSLVLTGGKSVLTLYKILSKSNANWNKWHIYISDERCVPIGHKDRGDQVINEIWLDNCTIPKKNIHFIKTEVGLIEAQKEYEKVLKKINKFDVVLLSIGKDGHISSLFPGHVYPENRDVIIERNSPKLPMERISMSYNRLNKANNIFKIIIGELKQPLVKKLLENKVFPADAVVGKREKIFIHNNAIPKKDKL